ncbi:galactoside O-acetyltransferase [Halarcobacter mediterraneus]|uniref:Galactoside O-acetyltransferase n=1 Tax=Halarcobacter mediterraneus TaxID=2023153 RepID=A0A4Q1AUR0_9BACT|nr:acyltransferase [Halarcobacter mediterraneus]RXK12280.1 galactoside O-acetyltransferase [Halarcobacter mediterraneus]
MINSDFEKIIHKGSNIHYEEKFRVFTGHHNIFLGSNIYLVDTLINAGDSIGKVTIEDYVFFGHGVKILARAHNYKVYNEQRQQDITEKPIHIKKGAWIASGAIILGGVTIGTNAVVGAGSVVTKDIPNNAVVTGNPAKIVKYTHRKLNLFEKLRILLN